MAETRTTRKIKALTISQPYASLIADGKKWVENRRWWTGYRGLLAIHAGKGTQYLSAAAVAASPQGVVAVATLAACIELDRHDATEAAVRILGTDRTIGDLLRHEHTEGPWCWVLTGVRKLAVPIRVSGAQGLWDFDLPEDTVYVV